MLLGNKIALQFAGKISRLFYLLFSAHDDRSHYNQPGEEFSHPNSYLDCNESCCGRGTSCSLGRSTLGGGQDSSIGNLGESSGDFCDCCTQCREAVEEGEVPQVNSTFEAHTIVSFSIRIYRHKIIFFHFVCFWNNEKNIIPTKYLDK